MTSFNRSPVKWVKPLSVTSWGEIGVLGTDPADRLGAIVSLHPAAVTSHAAMRTGRIRGRDIVGFSDEGFVSRRTPPTPQTEDTGGPWLGRRLERSLTVLLAWLV
jgi:hypothetical protein